ncbi:MULTISPECIES: helix-turn-helix transcriptional regulator [Rhodococcus]|uniref:helix-turn-helix transcriptional regulator n=1 Tax=Rhodococcus TaxID=1827 RepID=UPI0029553374|nr:MULTISPECIES: helix-turn-helix transcriptional regulator [Rhodococcus]MDV7246349.1 helix-turn-helix transcriptional regulator [Rhodococcus oxybenzonivorans]MDV7337369.1 helix-turn-helix transcriptional regulator [Rhodococcus oxybenzonivorans]MDV7347998.1 helix-turn-helix transcriptional regulator [Rhodococcus oxybenzonivorans]MDV8031650.1 helix-turn-helix transcriptional regulator [Rhodococcus sp. IEGM 27]
MRGFQPDQLERARRSAGVSQRELARLARLNADTIRRWELGDSSPQVDLLARVTAAIGVSISDLVKVPEGDRYPGDWRILRGLTQPQLGAAAGVTTQIVGSVERGEISLSDNVARKLSAALQIPESELRASYERVRTRPGGTPA